MKTEDIDKRIGMPDVDKEWARFEQEVIGKEAKAGKNLWLWGLFIAASIIIVAGLFFLNHDSRETEQLLKETSKHSISHEVVSEPSSSEKPAELIAKTSQPKKIKENRKGSTVTDYIYVSTANDNTFDCDEENAVFPGGEEALFAFIKANLKLPNLAIEYGAKGRIFTSFVIDSVGEVSDIRILERPQARISYDTPRLSQEPEDTQVKIKELIALQLGEEATRILSLMPRWRPAIWGGKPTKTRYNLPIIFEATKAEQQKFLAKNLTSESVDQALQEQIAGLDIVPNSSYLGNGTTMRLRGLGDSVIDQIGKTDSFLVVVNGKTLFDSRGMTSEEIDRRIEEYLNEQGLLQNIKIPCNNGAIAIWASTPEEREELQRMIAHATIVPTSADLGSGTTMRLRGTGDGPSDKDRIDSTLILVNGEPLPDSLKWQVFGESIDDVDTNMPRYFSRQGLLIDSVYVHKDSKFTEKYGGLAKYGVIEIKTVPDTYCDAYVRKHPKLKKKYTKVEGYVFDNNGKPLTEAYVHVERDFIGAATDSTGHFVFWVPRKDVTLRAEQPGYKSFEFSPSDKDIVTHHLEKTYNMRLRGTQEEQLAALPDFVPDENEVRLLPQGVIGGSHDSPPNDSILYLINGVPQPKENNKWLGGISCRDYLKGQHLRLDREMRHMNEKAKQRYIEKYGEAAKHGVIEYICVEDTLCDYYMDQHEELKASRRRVSGIVYDENDEPLAHTMIYIWHDKRVWGFETTDSLGNFTFWVPRTDVKMEFTYVGFYKPVVVEPSDTFQTIYLLPNDNLKSLRESLKF